MSVLDLTTHAVADDIPPCQGLPPHEVTRTRMAFLQAQSNTLVNQTQFADAKAGVLLTLMGLIALRGPVTPADLPAAGLMGWAVFLLNSLSLVFSIATILPRMPSRARMEALSRKERFSWIALSTESYDPAAHGAYVSGATPDELLRAIAARNQGMAVVLRRKFLALRIAFLAAIGSVITIVALLAAGAGPGVAGA